MEYTHTFEFIFSGDHEHHWEGEVNFNHGQHITMKFKDEPEFTAEEAVRINNLFSAVGALCYACGAPDSVEIKLKPIV